MSLKNFWYIACTSRELKTKPISVTVFDQKIVLFRDESKHPAALIDRCAHRNMALSKGKVVRGCVQCSYHGWSYNTQGKCVRIPSLHPERSIPDTAQVNAWRTAEQDGYVWIYPGEEPSTQTPFRFPHFEERGWTSFHMKTSFEASVEACLENFLDCPHTVYVHRGWFRNPHTQTLTAILRRHVSGVDVEFKNEPSSNSIISRLLYPKGKHLKHTDRFIMPNISRVDYQFGPDHRFIITSQCTPISEYQTTVYTTITYRYGIWGPLIGLYFKPMSRHIIHQDVEILSTQSQQLKLFRGPQFTHVETDLLGLRIQSMRARANRGVPEDQDLSSIKEISIRF
jgi:phenylpropionate dioxygenase-like ring-hydroxylating dioxygenase large terminal subunit